MRGPLGPRHSARWHRALLTPVRHNPAWSTTAFRDLSRNAIASGSAPRPSGSVRSAQTGAFRALRAGIGTPARMIRFPAAAGFASPTGQTRQKTAPVAMTGAAFGLRAARGVYQQLTSAVISAACAVRSSGAIAARPPRATGWIPLLRRKSRIRSPLAAKLTCSGSTRPPG